MMSLRSAVIFAVLLFLVTCPNGGLLEKYRKESVVRSACDAFATRLAPTRSRGPFKPDPDPDTICRCNMSWPCKSEGEPVNDNNKHRRKEEKIRQDCIFFSKQHLPTRSLSYPKVPGDPPICYCIVSWLCISEGSNSSSVSASELFAQENFNALDFNGDGLLTFAEFASALNSTGNSTLISC